MALVYLCDVYITVICCQLWNVSTLLYVADLEKTLISEKLFSNWVKKKLIAYIPWLQNVAEWNLCLKEEHLLGAWFMTKCKHHSVNQAQAFIQQSDGCEWLWILIWLWSKQCVNPRFKFKSYDGSWRILNELIKCMEWKVSIITGDWETNKLTWKCFWFNNAFRERTLTRCYVWLQTWGNGTDS